MAQHVLFQCLSEDINLVNNLLLLYEEYCEESVENDPDIRIQEHLYETWGKYKVSL